MLKKSSPQKSEVKKNPLWKKFFQRGIFLLSYKKGQSQNKLLSYKFKTLSIKSVTLFEKPAGFETASPSIIFA